MRRLPALLPRSLVLRRAEQHRPQQDQRGRGRAGRGDLGGCGRHGFALRRRAVRVRATATRSATAARGCTRSTGATSPSRITRPPPASPAAICPHSPPRPGELGEGPRYRGPRHLAPRRLPAVEAAARLAFAMADNAAAHPPSGGRRPPIGRGRPARRCRRGGRPRRLRASTTPRCGRCSPLGFSGMLQMKTWLATAALLVLVVVQVLTALWMWGRLPGAGPRRRGSARAPLERQHRVRRHLPVALHCLWSLGFGHHVRGCSCTASPAASSTAPTRRRCSACGCAALPGWALPVLGGTVFAAVRPGLVDVGAVVLHPFRAAADLTGGHVSRHPISRRSALCGVRGRRRRRRWPATPSPRNSCGGTRRKRGTTAANGYGAVDAAGGGTLLAALEQRPGGGGVILAKRQGRRSPAARRHVHAFSAVCTHQGCTVDKVAGGAISCPCHGSRFDAQTGAVIGGPGDRGRCRPSRSPCGMGACTGREQSVDGHADHLWLSGRRLRDRCVDRAR